MVKKKQHNKINLVTIVIIIFLIFRPSIKNMTNITQEDNANINSLLVESISGYETIKGLNLEESIHMFYKIEDPIRSQAGLWHDIGKLHTQHFDEYGIAHYYNHDCVGAYQILCHLEYYRSTNKKYSFFRRIRR